ncbi:hypothetical protein [Candidatus Sororendozoicomonas aggregata]|uniref:hypothetical protein n=1 Tax=Candidatus Sororendozoicomonas aggregata TaxID=3073239 RepID=UPI002ED4D830
MYHLQYICSNKLTDDIDSYVSSHIRDGFFDPLIIAVFLKESLPSEVVDSLYKVGTSVKSVIIHGLFKSTDKKVCFLIHEAVSRYLSNLDDIRYPYENHKFIYPKDTGIGVSEWGNGYGDISPHSDDLYENIDTDLLSLTILKDKTSSSTKIYDIEAIIEKLPKDLKEKILDMKFSYLSGKNVNGRLLKRDRSLVEKKGNKNYYNIDFRVESNIGERMFSDIPENKILLESLRLACKKVEPLSSYGKTGTFIVFEQ